MAGERRAEIAHGLYRCIAKRGYANTSVRDIARESGVALGLITHYFESKDEILYALADHVFEQYQESFVQFFKLNSDKRPNERLLLGIKFIFVDVAGDRDLIAVFQELINLSRHDRNLRRHLKKIYQRYRDTLADFLGRCAQGSPVPDKNLRKLAAFLVSASEGASLQWGLDPEGIKLPEMAEMAGQVVEAVLGNDLANVAEVAPGER